MEEKKKITQRLREEGAHLTEEFKQHIVFNALVCEKVKAPLHQIDVVA